MKILDYFLKISTIVMRRYTITILNIHIMAKLNNYLF